jgi:hypothetical protein
MQGSERWDILPRLARIGALLEIQSIREEWEPFYIRDALWNACDGNHQDIVEVFVTGPSMNCEMLCDPSITWKEDALRMVVRFFKPEWFPRLFSPLTIEGYMKSYQVIVLAEVMDSASIQQEYSGTYSQ